MIETGGLHLLDVDISYVVVKKKKKKKMKAGLLCLRD